MEWIAFAASALTAVLSLVGVYFSNRKSAALIEYRVKELEKSMGRLEEKVDKHNNFDKRLTVIETKLSDKEGKAS